MLEHSKRRTLISVILCVAVFCAMLVFFAVLHPVPIMDEDDVIYSVLVRKAVPLPGAWNPSRVMPEVLTSLCGNIAALCTALGFGRFIDCQVVVLGVILSLFITAYIYAFFCLLRIRFACGEFQAFCLSTLFLMLHFLIFRTGYSRNSFMFHTYDACCVFYYTISALLGCTLVMHFMTAPEEVPVFLGKHAARESVLLLAIYFELFSNLFGSVILAAYAGYRLINSAWQLRRATTNKKNENVRDHHGVEVKASKTPNIIRAMKHAFWKDNALWIGIFALWILAAALEATGGRASGARAEAEAGTLLLLEQITQSFSLFVNTLWRSNLFFKLLFFAVVTGVLILMLVKSEKRDQNHLSTIVEVASWGLATGVIVLLLCSAVEPRYAGRPEVIFPIVFILFLLLILGMNLILQNFPLAVRLLPFLLVLVYSMINTRFLTFQDSNPLQIDGHVAVAVENEIYETIIEKAKEGKKEITVRVIHSSEDGNWPHNGNIGDPIAQLFLKYGIIDHEIRVHTKPSDEMNSDYGIMIP